MKARHRAALTTFAAALLAACAATPTPPDRYYPLLPPSPAPDSVVAQPSAVLLEPFDAFGIYGERNLIYRRPEAGGALEQYRHQFWAEPPTLMLGDGLKMALRSALGPTRVHGRETRARPDYLIRPRLRRLVPRIAPLGSRAELAIEFSVVDQSNEPRFVLLFEESQAAAGNSPEAFVAAASALAAQANARFIKRLAEEFAR